MELVIRGTKDEITDLVGELQTRRKYDLKELTNLQTQISHDYCQQTGNAPFELWKVQKEIEDNVERNIMKHTLELRNASKVR